MIEQIMSIHLVDSSVKVNMQLHVCKQANESEIHNVCMYQGVLVKGHPAAQTRNSPSFTVFL